MLDVNEDVSKRDSKEEEINNFVVFVGIDEFFII